MDDKEIKDENNASESGTEDQEFIRYFLLYYSNLF